ncbi:MAG: homoserine kinase, partial [Anaerolineales bacterium]|nr:homoserine kinase [Anaerolineales bacterium]
MNGVSVRVPATSANLGPGFDCLALALDLYNEVRMRPVDDGIRVDVQGEGAASLPHDENNLVAQAALRAFESLDERPPGLDIHCHNRIPLGSGLGSSAAAVVAGLTAANALVEGDMGDEELLFLAFALEGHADNAAAALNGGLNLVRARPAELIVRKVPIP